MAQEYLNNFIYLFFVDWYLHLIWYKYFEYITHISILAQFDSVIRSRLQAIPKSNEHYLYTWILLVCTTCAHITHTFSNEFSTKRLTCIEMHSINIQISFNRVERTDENAESFSLRSVFGFELFFSFWNEECRERNINRELRQILTNNLTSWRYFIFLLSRIFFSCLVEISSVYFRFSDYYWWDTHENRCGEF